MKDLLGYEQLVEGVVYRCDYDTSEGYSLYRIGRKVHGDSAIMNILYLADEYTFHHKTEIYIRSPSYLADQEDIKLLEFLERLYNETRKTNRR